MKENISDLKIKFNKIKQMGWMSGHFWRRTVCQGQGDRCAYLRYGRPSADQEEPDERAGKDEQSDIEGVPRSGERNSAGSGRDHRKERRISGEGIQWSGGNHRSGAD